MKLKLEEEMEIVLFVIAVLVVLAGVAYYFYRRVAEVLAEALVRVIRPFLP
jgi:hypothetical protein